MALEVLQRAATHTALLGISLLLCISYVLWVVWFQSIVPLPLIALSMAIRSQSAAPFSFRLVTLAGSRVTWLCKRPRGSLSLVLILLKNSKTYFTATESNRKKSSPSCTRVDTSYLQSL